MIKFSVVIPLYNKSKSVVRAIESVLAQDHAPMEVIVVDDGSTDDSAQLVTQINNPLIRLITQENQGVSVARNSGISIACGNFIAFLDADDWWKPNFLAEIAALVELYPNCGLYLTAYTIRQGDTKHLQRISTHKGVINEFFKVAFENNFLLPSVCCVPKRVFDRVGMFPEGMKLGEDLYTWIRIAKEYEICYSPTDTANYSISADNRSGAIFKEEITKFSFDEFYKESGDQYLNELIAKCSIGKAITVCAKGGSIFPTHVENFYSYTKLYRRGLWRLKFMNRLPRSMRSMFNILYEYLSWHIARRGTL